MGVTKDSGSGSPTKREKKDFEDGFPLQREEKLPGYHDRPCSIWQRLPYRSDTGGVAPMFLEGREWLMAERTRGMTPERRAHRKQFLADQVLSHREPVHVPEIYYELKNPIRRFFNYPFKKVEEFLQPRVGSFLALNARGFLTYSISLVLFTYCATYYSMFHGGNWERHSGIRFYKNKPVVFPGDPDYPFTSTKSKADDYYDFGFKKSNMYKSEERILAEEAAKVKN